MRRKILSGLVTAMLISEASSAVMFSSGGVDQLTITFTEELVVTISPPAGGVNRVFGEFGNLLVFRNAFSSTPSEINVNPLGLDAETISTMSTGTTEIDGMTPASADFSFLFGGHGFAVGSVQGVDFFLKPKGNTYIPAGGEGVITFSAGSVTITNWTGTIPDNVVTQVDAAQSADGALTLNTTTMFVVPEPGSASLLGISLLGLSFWRRRY